MRWSDEKWKGKWGSREWLMACLQENLEFLKGQDPENGYTTIAHCGRYGNDNWAIVMAWCDMADWYGKADVENGVVPAWALCAKVAKQPINSIMQEYDIDWDMPMNKDGEIDDTEVTFVDETDFGWLIDQWERYKRELEEAWA
jgi:hypothetical protein